MIRSHSLPRVQIRKEFARRDFGDPLLDRMIDLGCFLWGEFGDPGWGKVVCVVTCMSAVRAVLENVLVLPYCVYRP